MSNYKVGDTIAPVELPLYWDKTSISSFISIGKGRKIKKIEGEFLQLEGDSTAWIKLSDLPPKYKIGDIVTDDNGKNLYRIDKIENGMYYSRDGGNFNSCLATDSMRHATEEELKRYKNMEKKIIGYKFKPEFEKYEKAAISIIAPKTAYPTATRFVDFPDNRKDFLFGNDSLSSSVLKEAGVLDLWFEPVYEPKETKFKFGDKQIEVIFGKGYIKAQGKTITREQLSGLLDMMEGTTFDPIEGWTVSFPKVKIGCCTFDAGEIDTMIGDYDELNS